MLMVAPSASLEYFDKAIENYEAAYGNTKRGIFRMLSEYSRLSKKLGQGLIPLLKTNYDDSTSQFKAGLVLAEDSFTKLSEYLKDSDQATRARHDLLLSNLIRKFKSYYYISDAKHNSQKRDFRRAYEQWTRACELSGTTIENLKAHPQDISVSTKWTLTGEHQTNLGWKSLAEAQMYRDRGDWDNALLILNRARDEWDEAGLSYLKTRSLLAEGLQEEVVRLTPLIDSVVYDIERERKLVEKITTLEAQLSNLIQNTSSGSVNIDVSSKAIADSVSITQQNTEIVTKLENKIKVIVDEVLPQLDKLTLPADRKAEISREARDLVDSTDHGKAYMDKARRFVGQLGKVATEVGTAAAPLVPIIAQLSALVV